MTLAHLGAVLMLLLVSTEARAAEGDAHGSPGGEPDRHYVVGLGGAFALEMADRRVNAGGNAFFELDAIEGWLEIEAGISLVKVATGAEMSSDLLLKKPFRLRKGI